MVSKTCLYFLNLPLLTCDLSGQMDRVSGSLVSLSMAWVQFLLCVDFFWHPLLRAHYNHKGTVVLANLDKVNSIWTCLNQY